MRGLGTVLLTVALLSGVGLRAGDDQTAEELARVPRIGFDAFKALHDRDAVRVVDVRDAESFRNGHIPGAVSIPLGEVAARADELRNERRPIVTYCA